MNGKHLTILILVVALLLLVTACAAGPNTERDTPRDNGEVAGFWQGLWHGIILPVAFAISLFNDGVGVYEVHNNGHWYDFGFVLGTSVLLGGALRGRRT